MNKFSTVSLAPLAALLLAGSALAQTTPSPDTNRADRRCTSATLSTDASTQCPDDVVKDPGASPVVVRAPANSTAGSGTGTGTTTGGTGTASSGTAGSMGSGSTGSSMGTPGMRR
jgi:hypothetical protein